MSKATLEYGMHATLAEFSLRTFYIGFESSKIERSIDVEEAKSFESLAKAKLKGAMFSASLARLIPSLLELAKSGASPDGLVRASGSGNDVTAIFLSETGQPDFHVEIKQDAPSDRRLDPPVQFTLRGFENSGTPKSPCIAFGLLRDGGAEVEIEGFVRGGVATQEWFRFSEAAMKRLVLREPEKKVNLTDGWGNIDALFSITGKDGGLAGVKCQEILEAQSRLLAEAVASREGMQVALSCDPGHASGDVMPSFGQ